MIYKYIALDKKGKRVTGLVEAANESRATDMIIDKDYTIIAIEEKGKRQSRSIDYMLSRVSPKELVVFTRQFSVLISASVSLVESLRLLVEVIDNPKFKIVILEIADSVDNGNRLSEALEKQSDVFSGFYISIVRSGETSGKLDEVLNYLADELEKDYDMMSKIKGAMIYPAFVFVGLVAVGIVMMVFVVPQLVGVITSTGGELPIATKIMIAISDFLVKFWWMLLVFGIGTFVLVKMFYNTPKGKRVWSNIIIRLPIFGKLFSRIYLVRFTRSMSTLLVGGVTINNALGIVANVVGNDVYKDIILETRTRIEDGASISSVFVEHKEMPTMVSHMIGVGEKTGRLDTVLERITDFYAREIENITANLMTLMEPIIMVVMGIGVGIMVAAVIMPMYSMANSF